MAMFARATRVVRAVTKTHTGLVGLHVDVNGRTNLIKMQEQILTAVQCIPQGAAFRDSVEKTARYRLKVATEIEDEEEIERTIGMGQLEELIDQGNDELICIDYYHEEKGWEKKADAEWFTQMNADIKQAQEKEDEIIRREQEAAAAAHGQPGGV